MQILMIVGTFPARSETFIFRKAVTLAQRGHQVTLAARGRGDWQLYADESLPDNLRMLYLLPDVNLRQPGRLVRLLVGLLLWTARAPLSAYRLWRRLANQPRRWRVFVRHLPFVTLTADVIHYEFAGSAKLYPLLTDLLNAPQVVSCRGLNTAQLSANQPEQIAILTHADAVHCVSDELAGRVTQLTGRDDGLHVNHPAIDPAAIAVKTTYVTTEPPLIVTARRLFWSKGFDYLLAALARLKQQGVPFRAHIIGEGQLWTEIRFSITDLDLEPEVRMIGGLPPGDVLRRLTQADIYVLSSHYEGISNGALEAMAAGLPIVTTNAGGMSEAVRDGVDGLVVPIRDVDALANALKRLLSDASLRERLGRAGRARVEQDFTLAGQAATFEDIYAAAGQRFSGHVHTP